MNLKALTASFGARPLQPFPSRSSLSQRSRHYPLRATAASDPAAERGPLEQLTTSSLQPESEGTLAAVSAPSGDGVAPYEENPPPSPLNPTEAQSSDSDDSAAPAPAIFEEQDRQQQGEPRTVEDGAGASEPGLTESPAKGYSMAPGMYEIIQGASRMQGLIKALEVMPGMTLQQLSLLISSITDAYFLAPRKEGERYQAVLGLLRCLDRLAGYPWTSLDELDTYLVVSVQTLSKVSWPDKDGPGLQRRAKASLSALLLRRTAPNITPGGRPPKGPKSANPAALSPSLTETLLEAPRELLPAPALRQLLFTAHDSFSNKVQQQGAPKGGGGGGGGFDTEAQPAPSFRLSTVIELLQLLAAESGGLERDRAEQSSVDYKAHWSSNETGWSGIIGSAAASDGILSCTDFCRVVGALRSLNRKLPTTSPILRGMVDSLKFLEQELAPPPADRPRKGGRQRGGGGSGSISNGGGGGGGAKARSSRERESGAAAVSVSIDMPLFDEAPPSANDLARALGALCEWGLIDLVDLAWPPSRALLAAGLCGSLSGAAWADIGRMLARTASLWEGVGQRLAVPFAVGAATGYASWILGEESDNSDANVEDLLSAAELIQRIDNDLASLPGPSIPTPQEPSHQDNLRYRYALRRAGRALAGLATSNDLKLGHPALAQYPGGPARLIVAAAALGAEPRGAYLTRLFAAVDIAEVRKSPTRNLLTFVAALSKLPVTFPGAAAAAAGSGASDAQQGSRSRSTSPGLSEASDSESDSEADLSSMDDPSGSGSRAPSPSPGRQSPAEASGATQNGQPKRPGSKKVGSGKSGRDGSSTSDISGGAAYYPYEAALARLRNVAGQLSARDLMSGLYSLSLLCCVASGGELASQAWFWSTWEAMCGALKKGRGDDVESDSATLGIHGEIALYDACLLLTTCLSPLNTPPTDRVRQSAALSDSMAAALEQVPRGWLTRATLAHLEGLDLAQKRQPHPLLVEIYREVQAVCDDSSNELKCKDRTVAGDSVILSPITVWSRRSTRPLWLGLGFEEDFAAPPTTSGGRPRSVKPSVTAIARAKILEEQGCDLALIPAWEWAQIRDDPKRRREYISNKVRSTMVAGLQLQRT